VKNQRRRLSSAFFGMLLLLPLLAIGFLQLGQAYIKSTREERLDTEKLVKIVLPASKVVWEEEDRELWVGDKMFDVASLDVIDGHYHLTGVFDEDETKIAGSLLHVIFSKKGNDLLQLLLLLQCFSASLLLPGFERKYDGSRRRFPAYATQLLSLPKRVLGPPPRQ
jgi:hypothetical protein